MNADMDTRRQLADRVDTELTRGERETDLSFFDTDDEAVLTSYSPAIVRSLLRHQEAEIRWVYASGGEEPTGLVRNLSALLDTEVSVEGVRARIPKGCLTVKGTVRADNTDSGIVNTPDDADEVREAFADGGFELPNAGDWVRDLDAGDDLIVIDTDTTTPAEEVTLPDVGGLTVADLNPEYEPTAPVVKAVYVDAAEKKLDGWRSVEDLIDAVEFGAITAHTFPADRLTATPEVEL